LHASLLIDSLFLVLRRQQQTNPSDEEVAAVMLKIKEAATSDHTIGAVVLCYYPELAADISANDVSTIVAKLTANFYNKSQNPLRVSQALAHIARDTENTNLASEVLKFLFFHGFYVPNTTASSKKAKKRKIAKYPGITLASTVNSNKWGH